MAYHEEDRVSRLIQNYVLWAGESPVRSCASLFDEEKINLRELRQEWRSSYRMEVLGVEAQLTKETLEAMESQLRFPLWTFHLSSLTFEMQAREIVKTSKATYHRRLVEGHVAFIEGYDAQVAISRERSRAYVRLVAPPEIMGNTR